MRIHTRTELTGLFQAALTAVDPQRLVGDWLRRNDIRPTSIIAVGKAAPAMAFGAVEALGPIPGLVVTNRTSKVPKRMELLVAGHPIPDRASLLAGGTALSIAGNLTPIDHLLVLISGGASALLEIPRRGITLTDLVATTELLLRSGADIDSVNAIRRELSQIKGGGLARAVGAARVTTLALSDVISEDPSVIGSGPTVAVPGAASGLRVAEWLGIASELPSAVRDVLATPQDVPATPLDDYAILASGSTAAQAVVEAARSGDRTATVATSQLDGEARETARWALDVARSQTEDVCVFAGETTVTVHGSGRGGRNQEAALAAAIDLGVTPGPAFLAAGTDGIDGMTDAAGAIVDGDTVGDLLRTGIDPAAALDNNDSGTALEACNATIVTGDTGTNVGDIWITLRV